MTVTLFVLGAAVAVGDWAAVWQRLFRLEFVLKPLTMVLLIAAAASAELPGIKGYVVAALLFGLVGDIALLLSRDVVGRLDAPFLLGLTAFLAGHVCYLAAFARFGLHGVQLIAGALVVVGAAALTLPRILMRAHRIGGQELLAIIATYAAVLAAMTVLGVGTASVPIAIGALLFLASDLTIAWERFVRKIPRGPVLVIVTYHLAQLLIVVGLVRH